ncbi:glycosyltransferase family 2 protein [Streptomyces mobaraensis NBRC 13819 = DSM 40847]|uniref:glycosyltransferase family 2 protein n=1 Tax=Streptomyces mobaraensis TaxID=35621 RepID=UPI001B318860|nr:glycosyltransferase family 2 protein [Streptomyces mobaraensis]QTT74089.1 glycosyltransferase family 2 protein [Streptomyces mobaraensis NBRC 13819 = DSM 40847]
MSAHSDPPAHHPAPPAFDLSHPPAFPRHVVTAVLVAHDGARWLPDALAGLLGQERPVQRAVAADTGSDDDSARLLADALGADRVLHLARRAGFGTAVDEAVRATPAPTADDLPYLAGSSGWDPVSRTWRDDPHDPYGSPDAHDRDAEPVQWLWLLHDDCAPEPGALRELLRVADQEIAAGRPAAVLGPKLRSWYDRRQLLEVGVTVARGGRRWTGLDRREQDQGQHDQVRSVLSVSSAGMLVRRDVWEALGGFDPRLPLMRDDVDFCWRAHAAGHRVLVAPDAVLRHAEAASRERRPVDCVGRRPASPHRVDKAGAVYALLANTRAAALPYVLLRIVLGTLLSALGHLVGKVPGQALDELTGLGAVLLRPGRIRAARGRRAAAVDAKELRPLFPPPGATLRVAFEQVMTFFGGRSDPEARSAGRHGAVESGPGGDEADFLEIEQFARLRRIARKPAPVLFTALLLVSAVACRGLYGGGALAGGALLPVPEGASDLWSLYADGWHAVGTGSTASAPPYLAVLAALSTLLLGSPDLAVTLLLVCSVPLAGLTAYFASRPLVASRPLRAWGSVAYAFLPAVTGALATGRLGTAVLAILLPLLARAAVAAGGFRSPGARPVWRAVWTYALLLTVATAFAPVVWPLAVVLGLGVLALRARGGGLVPHALALLAVAATPLLVLAPWSLGLLTDPGRLLTEAGTEYGGGTGTPLRLLTADPGGPRTFGGLLFAGVLLAALGALLRADRRAAVGTAWTAALAALLCAALVNHTAWAGPALLVYGLALTAAAVVGAEGARERVAAKSFGWRQPVAGLVALAAAAGPLAAAVTWAAGGAGGPLERRDPVQVPAFVAEAATTRDRARTLVLAQEPGHTTHLTYALVRGSGIRMGDDAVAPGRDARLDSAVADLVAGSGADQAARLAEYAVGFVLVRDGAAKDLGAALDAAPGLTRLSQEGRTALWRVDRPVSRVGVVTEGADPVAVPSGPVGARATIPAGKDGRVLRLADRAAPGWRATLDGRPLPRVTLDGWAQGFRLPAAGGRLALSYETPFARTAWVWTQGLLAVVLVVLALPGRRRHVDDDLPDAVVPAAEPVSLPEQAPAGEGRRARRLRAAAEGRQAADGTGAPEAVPVSVPVSADPYEEPSADAYAAADPYAADPYAAAPAPQYGQGAADGGWAADPYAPYGSDGSAAYPQYYPHGAGGYGDAYPGQGHHAGAHPDTAGYDASSAPGPYGVHDPYGYGGGQGGRNGHDTTYDAGHGLRRDGSDQQ